MRGVHLPFLAVATIACLTMAAAFAQEVRYFDLPLGARPHDVAPAADGQWHFIRQA